MTTSSLNNIYSNIESTLSNALQAVDSPTTKGNSSSGVTAGSDSGTLSPLAQILSQLQHLQQSDPSKYAQVTQQISSNLQAAAQADTASGNTAGAAQLTTLAKDFNTASTSGQLPNIQDLAAAIGDGAHHHHGHGGGSSDSSSDSNAASSTANAVSQALQQLLSAVQNNAAQSSSQNPLAIIANTLSNAGS